MIAAILAATSFAPLPKLEIRGEAMVDPNGQTVTLRGANLGNWLLIEGWMLGYGEEIHDQYTFEENLAQRFGVAAKDRFMERYRENFMRKRDWEILQRYRMNLVRLPINYRLLEDDENPKRLKRNAWKWIDRAVNEAERHGMYVILDMHGIQGGQSEYDHTGRRGQNRVWTDESAQDRAGWLWQEIAKRYRNRHAVVAYDLFNEPYGGTKPQQVALFERLYREVRKHDPDKLIFAHGNYDDFAHYGDPKARGWKNVGFQMHYYPGLFGGGPAVPMTHLRHFNSMQGVERQQNALNVPFLIGEFNPVFGRVGGAAMTRRHFDLFAKHGWMATIWSYKVISIEGGFGEDKWGLATNVEPMPKVDFRTAPLGELERWVDALATQRVEPYPDLLATLAPIDPELPPLPEIPPPITEAPQGTLPGWTSADIGGARRGGLDAKDSGFALYGGGADIWGESDQFRFLYQALEGDFAIETTVRSLLDTHGYAKAGLMVRESTDADAPHTLLSVFPSGEIQIAHRATKGGGTDGSTGVEGAMADLRLRIVRRGNVVECFYRKPAAESWTSLGKRSVKPGIVLAGVVALSHDDTQLTRVDYGPVIVNRLN